MVIMKDRARSPWSHGRSNRSRLGARAQTDNRADNTRLVPRAQPSLSLCPLPLLRLRLSCSASPSTGSTSCTSLFRSLYLYQVRLLDARSPSVLRLPVPTRKPFPVNLFFESQAQAHAQAQEALHNARTRPALPRPGRSDGHHGTGAYGDFGQGCRVVVLR